VAGAKRPSFLKRNKEQRRAAKAAEKRAARSLRQKIKAERERGSGAPIVSAGDVDEFGVVTTDTVSADEEQAEGDEYERD